MVLIKLLKQKWRLSYLSLTFLFSSCAVSLAPKFDQGIVDNLSATSTDIFQLLAGVSEGTNSSDFNQREEKYNNLIGKIEALELQIKARPLPKNKKIEKIIEKANNRLSERKVGALITIGDTAPSATALEQIVKNLEQMKTTDKTNGLKPGAVAVFKGFIELYLDQALTYERFLNK